MNREALLNTAITYWSDEDESFITTSPLSDIIAGDGDTLEESMTSFIRHVDATYESYKKGNHAIYNAPGRPKKGKVTMSLQVSPEVKEALDALKDSLGGISQGEVIEFLEAHHRLSSKKGENSDLENTLASIKTELVHIIDKFKRKGKSEKVYKGTVYKRTADKHQRKSFKTTQ